MTDDQRAAERIHRERAMGWDVGMPDVDELLTEHDGLRAELVETRDRRDYLQGQLDIIYDAEYSRNDTLKRRVAVLEGAGNTLARAAVDLPDAYSIELDDALRAWRSAAGTPTTEGGQS